MSIAASHSTPKASEMQQAALLQSRWDEPQRSSRSSATQDVENREMS